MRSTIQENGVVFNRFILPPVRGGILRPMQKMHYAITIRAPREKVYETMLAPETYREWTSVFSPGSTYVGDWSEGSEMRFIGPDPDHPETADKNSGMIARVAKNVPNEFVSLESVGQILAGVDDRESDDVRQWAGALEEYTFADVDGGTEVRIDQDTPEAFIEQFAAMWPKGLEKLKEICER